MISERGLEKCWFQMGLRAKNWRKSHFKALGTNCILLTKRHPTGSPFGLQVVPRLVKRAQRVMLAKKSFPCAPVHYRWRLERTDKLCQRKQPSSNPSLGNDQIGSFLWGWRSDCLASAPHLVQKPDSLTREAMRGHRCLMLNLFDFGLDWPTILGFKNFHTFSMATLHTPHHMQPYDTRSTCENVQYTNTCNHHTTMNHEQAEYRFKAYR